MKMQTSLVLAVVKECDAHLISIRYVSDGFYLAYVLSIYLFLYVCVSVRAYLLGNEGFVSSCTYLFTVFGLDFSAGSIHKAYAGESEQLLRDAFAESSSKARLSGKPVVIFIDEIDALCPQRDSRYHKTKFCSLVLLDTQMVVMHE
jgi:hypothetical protein